MVTIIIRGGKSLRKNTNLILTFDKQSMVGMYEKYNPVAWKITAFPQGGGGVLRGTYAPELAFATIVVGGDIIESASYATHINTKQQTTLTADTSITPPVYAFSKPVAWVGAKEGEFQCVNDTHHYQNIGVGFYQTGAKEPTISLVLNEVPGNTAAVAKFTPILSAYIAAGYQADQILKTQMQGKIEWELNLEDPSAHLSWVLEETKDGFILVKD